MVGAGLGLGLGAVFLAAGMGGHAAEHARSEQLRNAAAFAYAEAQATPASASESFGQSVMRLMAPSPAKLLNAERRPSRARDLECLAQAVYYEARGESPQGQFAVAQVVMNRVRHPAFPKSVCDVVFQGAHRRSGCQFSFACDGSMRGHREASAWTRARRIAARALSGAAIAEVGSATHFHTTGVSPAWGPQMRRVAQVGMHVFYRFAPRRPSAPAATPLDPLAPLAPLGAAVVLTAGPASEGELKLQAAVVETPAEASGAAAPEAAPAAPPAEAKPAQTPPPAAEATLKTPRPATEGAS